MHVTRWAIFSDIHSNYEALEAVLADIESLKVPGRLCLGDVVGYNASPAECVDRLRALGWPVIQGNHDALVASDSETELDEFNPVARLGLLYSRRQLSPRQKQWLSQLPRTFRTDAFGAVHASLSDPDDWVYILSLYEAREHFLLQDRPVFFCGHTHYPAVFACDAQRKRLHLLEPRPEQVKFNPALNYLINVGSIGQPRDRDHRACYGILDLKAGTFEYRRVPYAVEKAQDKVRRAGLPELLATRLRHGM